MIVLHYNKKKLSLPASWDELSAKQFIAIAKLFHQKITDEIMLFEKSLQVLARKNLFAFYRLPADMRLRSHKHIEWLFTEPITSTQLIIKYKGFYGPESDFGNILLSEFHHTEMAYFLYKEEKDEDALNELIAILYRAPVPHYDKKKNTAGDIRLPFFYTEVQYNKRKVARWPLAVKHAILLWYDACRQQLEKDYPLAFEKSNTTQSDNIYDGMYEMIRGLSGPKYGKFDEVEQLNVHLAFKDVNQSIWEAKELKRKHPQLYE